MLSEEYKIIYKEYEIVYTTNEGMVNIEIKDNETGKIYHSKFKLFKVIKELQQENQKYKEVIDKIQKHCEIEINASNHYLENHSSQQELCHKVAHQRILNMLKEVK